METNKYVSSVDIRLFECIFHVHDKNITQLQNYKIQTFVSTGKRITHGKYFFFYIFIKDNKQKVFKTNQERCKLKELLLKYIKIITRQFCKLKMYFPNC